MTNLKKEDIIKEPRTFKTKQKGDGMKYFAPKLASSMLPVGELTLRKKDLTPVEAREFTEESTVIFSFGRHYEAVLDVIKTLFEIEIRTQDDPPKFGLKEGDSLVVFQVGNLPPLTNGAEYTREQAIEANFRFTLLELVSVEQVQY